MPLTNNYYTYVLTNKALSLWTCIIFIIQSFPEGYIYHSISKQSIDLKEEIPDFNTELVFRDKSKLLFHFVPKPMYGHFGYIKQSGMYVGLNPLSKNPSNNTGLSLYNDESKGALFAFNEGNKTIQHIEGKFWHPFEGFKEPIDGTPVVLYENLHASTTFYFGDADANKISPYPDPEINGDWILVNDTQNPEGSGTRTGRYKVGREQTKSVKRHCAWSVSPDVAKHLFSSSSELSEHFRITYEDTWSSAHDVNTEVEVKAGKSFVVWQFAFIMTQYEEELTFWSDIFKTTDSKNEKPTLLTDNSVEFILKG